MSPTPFSTINENSDVDDGQASVGSSSPCRSFGGLALSHKTTSMPTQQHDSVASCISTISDQSFVDDFQSITAELESIDSIVRSEVVSGSMASLFGDFKDLGLKSNERAHTTSSYSDSQSADVEAKRERMARSYSVETSGADSLQSDYFQLQGIESQIVCDL